MPAPLRPTMASVWPPRTLNDTPPSVASSAPAYETLLLDVMIGEATLFTRSEEVEAAWRIVDPLLKFWESNPPKNLETYPAGSSGPDSAIDLIGRDHAKWRPL